MKPTLKQQNLPMKFTVYLGLGLLFLWIAGLLPEDVWEWLSKFETKKLVTEGTLPFLALSVLSIFLGGTVRQIWKERFVHFRWSNPLPGSRAFTHHAAMDTRIDKDALEAKYGLFPTGPSDQNRLFYTIYKTCRDDPAVTGSHRNYLLFRDLSFDTFLLSWVSAGCALFFGSGFMKSATVFVVALVISLAFAWVANNYSHRFVCNALANSPTS